MDEKVHRLVQHPKRNTVRVHPEATSDASVAYWQRFVEWAGQTVCFCEWAQVFASA